MAKVAKKTNHLRGDLRLQYLTEIILISVIVISIILSFIITPYAISGAFLSVLLIKGVNRKIRILKFGLEGEEEVLKSLIKLPKKYSILNDVLIVDKDKSSQIDFIVIGSNGIFIVESKHVKGTIKGNVDSTYLNKVKFTNGENSYSKKMYNPILQVLGHKKGLTKYLRTNGCYNNVIPIVYFSSDAKIKIKSDKVALITKEQELLNYIKKYRQEATINSDKQKEIINLLKKC